MAQRPSLSPGTMVVLGAAGLLFIDTFLDWQRACVLNFCASRDAWHGFWGVFLGLLTLALLAWMGLQIARVDLSGVQLPLSPAQLTAALAGLVFLFAVIKNLVDDFSAWASWVGIVLAAGAVVGAAMRVQEEAAGAGGGPFAPRGGGFAGPPAAGPPPAAAPPPAVAPPPAAPPPPAVAPPPAAAPP